MYKEQFLIMYGKISHEHETLYMDHPRVKLSQTCGRRMKTPINMKPRSSLDVMIRSNNKHNHHICLEISILLTTILSTF
jgi:hypothetical protein